MTDQEIRAKARELAIATFAMLPEENRTKQIKLGISQGREVHQILENLADLYIGFINSK